MLRKMTNKTRNEAGKAGVNPGERFRSNRGITLIMAGAGMFCFLGFVALAVDMGMLYRVRNDSQNIADAAALAGAREAFIVPNGDKVAAAKQGAKSAASANYTPESAADIRLRDADILVVDNATEHTVKVTIRRTVANGNPVTTFFAPIVGIPAASVTATATAEAYIPTGGPSGPRFGTQCIKPWLLPDINPNTGQPYSPADIGTDIIIKGGNPQTDAVEPGQFYPLDLQYNGITPNCPSCEDPASNTTGADLYRVEHWLLQRQYRSVRRDPAKPANGKHGGSYGCRHFVPDTPGPRQLGRSRHSGERESAANSVWEQPSRRRRRIWHQQRVASGGACLRPCNQPDFSRAGKLSQRPGEQTPPGVHKKRP